jgi:hypothetical protein
MFALASGGAGGEAPVKKRCHPEAASADRLPPKDLVTPHLQGRRGACTKKSDMNNRKTKVKPPC